MLLYRKRWKEDDNHGQNKKIENDMLAVSKKLDKFDFASAPPAKATKRRYTKKSDTPIIITNH